MSNYPTDDDLDYLSDDDWEQIETWPWHDIAGCLDFVKASWHWPDLASHNLSAHEGYVVRADPEDRYLRLVTGGWSGNEELVGALESNRTIHRMAWRMSARGGLHIYQYPEAT